MCGGLCRLVEHQSTRLSYTTNGTKRDRERVRERNRRTYNPKEGDAKRMPAEEDGVLRIVQSSQHR